MQTILGSGGAIGVELAKCLKSYTPAIRLVSRNPKKISDADELVSANLLEKADVYRALEGSTICYLTVGLEYSGKVWEQQWPMLVKNVVEACESTGTKLVFFDNVYAIGGDNVKHISEASPISPVSRKGAVRAEIDNYIMQQVEKGKLQAIIARAPDFFGPVKEKSILMTLVYDNLAKGKKAQWLCNSGVVHSMGYTPDLAKGTAMLGNTATAYNQVWNLPVDKQALSGKAWTTLFAEEMKVKDGCTTLPAWLLKTLGWFIPMMGEIYEMRYQFDRDFYFDSDKFINHFNFTPTPNAKAVRKTIAALSNSVEAKDSSV